MASSSSIMPCMASNAAGASARVGDKRCMLKRGRIRKGEIDKKGERKRGGVEG